MDADFEKLKQRTEAELGRPLDHEEEHELKLLFYFGKGVALKNTLDTAPSEPECIGPIAERVLADIERRVQQQRRRSRTVQAMREFFSGKKERPRSQKKHNTGKVR